MTLSVWIHANWYLLLLPIAAFFLARQWRGFVRLAISAIAAVLIGSSLTGRPFVFLQQTLRHFILALNTHPVQRVLAVEFQPFTGELFMVFAVSLMLIWRVVRRTKRPGIVYSDVMDIFYEMFFQNPRAGWRYMAGFEPALMPPEDLAIYRNIQLIYKSYGSFEPWIKKMRPEDRLIVRCVPGDPMKIPDLEWRQAGPQTWIGRLQRK